MASDVRKDDEEFENGAFGSTGAYDRHLPGDAGAARREPVPDEADLAAMARERNEHIVGDASDFPAGSHQVVTIGGRQIGIFNINGEFYGLPNVCPHQTGPSARVRRRPVRWSRARRTTGSSGGTTRARSSPAPGTASSTTCRPGDVWPSRISTCAATRSSSRTARSRSASDPRG
jgi:hypothetical protein